MELSITSKDSYSQRRLRDLRVIQRKKLKGNTLIVIEHNLNVIKCADWVIDMGPGGGNAGGRIVAEGTPAQVAKTSESVTGPYLDRVMQRGNK